MFACPYIWHRVTRSNMRCWKLHTYDESKRGNGRWYCFNISSNHMVYQSSTGFKEGSSPIYIDWMLRPPYMLVCTQCMSQVISCGWSSFVVCMFWYSNSSNIYIYQLFRIDVIFITSCSVLFFFSLCVVYLCIYG